MLERECASLPHVDDKESHRRKSRRRSASQASNGTSTTKPPQLQAIKSQQAISWNAHHARISHFPRRRRRTRRRSTSHQQQEQKHSMNCRKKNKKKRQRPGSIDLNTHKQPTQLRKAAKQVLFRKGKSSSSIRCVWFTDRIEIEMKYKITKAAEGKGRCTAAPARPPERAQQASKSVCSVQTGRLRCNSRGGRPALFIDKAIHPSIHTVRDSGTELN